MTSKETIASIGSPIPLHGIVTEPPTGAAGDMTLVILNSGLLHHVGSCLLSVRMARRAAASGIRTIRFDNSGIGDSAVRPTTTDHEVQSVDETCEVLAYAKEQWGGSRFALAGLCSGAFASFEAALRDDSVVGIVGIAPFGFRTRTWYVNHYRDLFLSSARWRGLGRKLLGRARPEPENYDDEFLEASANAGWKVPPQETMKAGYETLVARGVQFLYTFTSGEADYYNYEGQMRDMFPNVDFGTSLTECHLPKARHIITEPIHQQQVLDQTHAWLETLRGEMA